MVIIVMVRLVILLINTFNFCFCNNVKSSKNHHVNVIMQIKTRNDNIDIIMQAYYYYPVIGVNHRHYN